MIISKPVFTALAMVMLVTSAAMAATCENPNAVSKWSQYPDETSNGIDIRMDRVPPFQVRRTLADDFLCTQTGQITCVRFWGSWDKDNNDPANLAKGQIKMIHLSIHSDVPAVTDPLTGQQLKHSYPGELLWEMDFDATSFNETLHLDLCPDPTAQPCEKEGFWDPVDTPNDPPYTAGADSRIWLYTVSIPPSDAFKQKGTSTDPVVYWLDIYVVVEDDDIDHKFGWKTASEHWNDDAVYDYDGTNWAELLYPPGHPYCNDGTVCPSLDLSFEIYTEEIPTQACCYEDAAGIIICDDLTVAECMAVNGLQQGVNTNCATLDPPCIDPAPLNQACCLPDGSCVNTTPGVCLAHNGTPQGVGSDCSNANIDCNGCIPASLPCPNGQSSIGSSFKAGAIDNFAPAPDPALPDPALNNFINNCTAAPGIPLQFDELPGFAGVPANSWFGHTFINLPPNIVSATLEVRARATPGAGGGLAFNDTIGFVDTISGCSITSLWSNRFMNLPEATGTWTPGQAETFCLDLDALPIGTSSDTTSIINDLASGRLSIFVQDDTGIDYIILNITICPCEYPIIITIPVEVNDNFAAPDTAPASPSAEIATAFTGLIGFDRGTPNRRFAHTFTGLPPNIVGGTLQIGLRAHADIPGNDGLYFEFLNPNFRWGRAISTLAPAGPWNSGTAKVVTLNLASLPMSGTGVTTVIGDMADGDLDVFVQDDTAVDYMILKLKVCCDEGIPGDIDHDGDVDWYDVNIQMNHWLDGVVSPAP